MWLHAGAGPSMKGAAAVCFASGTTCMWCVCVGVWLLCLLCLFRIEVKRISALKPAFKSNKFAIVPGSQSTKPSIKSSNWAPFPPFISIEYIQ